MEEKPKNRESKIKANNKYKNKTYKRIAIDIRPETAEEIKNTAKSEGKSIAGYITDLHKKHIEETTGK